MKKVLLFGLVITSLLISGCSDKPKGKVRVASDMDDVVIYIDGKKKTTGGKEYTDMLLEEGEHEIKVVKKFDDRWSNEAMKKIVVGAETSQKITVNISELVKDNETGLMWQDDEAVKIVRKPWVTKDNYDHKVYDDTNGDTAVEYCKNLSLGGLSNWRVPNLEESKTLILAHHEPAIQPIFRNLVDYGQVTSTASEKGNKYLKTVGFDFGGYFYSVSKDQFLYVRCINDTI